MTIYTVHVHRRTHTCPADPYPHPYDTVRTLIHTTPGGPCRAPVTIHSGHTTTVIPCGRTRPVGQQCGACKPIVVEHAITTEHTGHHTSTPAGTGTPIGTVMPAGHAPRPCQTCGQPLANVLADCGRHLLCPRPRPTRRAVGA